MTEQTASLSVRPFGLAFLASNSFRGIGGNTPIDTHTT